MTTTNTYNTAGALLRSRTQTDPLSLLPQSQMRQYYDEAFSYTRGGLISEKYFTQDGESRKETYGYDEAARLTHRNDWSWDGSQAGDAYRYGYDAVGNRISSRTSKLLNYFNIIGTNQLTRVADVAIVNGVTAGRPTYDDQLAYDPDGSMISRTKFRIEGGYASQRIEEYAYDAFNLVRWYRTRSVSVPEGGLGTCMPDASSAPADIWSYRFGPLQEREQKRQLVSAADTTLAWVYTLVGADGRQLATYNGLQGNLCQRNAVRLWPVEFNTYGPNNTRIITRADGTSEVVISDYLGSARVTLSTAEPLQSTSYHPYGTERSNVGSGARTSYIGREHDKETELGFYGVRLYEPEYGRFLSTDPLWGEFPQTSTYVYADNEPITKKDPSGLMPTALIGFAIGAAIEIGFQVVVEGKKPSEIDGKKVFIAGAAGALTGGVSSIANATLRAGAMGAISAAEGAAKRMVDGDRGINVEKLGIDALLGYGASRAADRLAVLVASSPSGKSLARDLKRAENILDNGRTRASHVANVVSLRESVASLGRGPGEEVIVGTAKEAAGKLIESFLAPAIQRDHTNVQRKK